MLADNSARAASFGLNSFLHLDFPVACKTGTSSDYRDNWTIGYTPEFTVAVWVGNPDGTPMRSITGVTGAAPVMHDVFQYLHDRFGTSWFNQPARITSYSIDPLTGRQAPKDRAGAINEKCLYPPEAARPDDYDKTGRVRLPAIYTAWLGGAQNNLGSLAIASGASAEMRVTQPAEGSTYYVDSDLPADTQRIPLRAEADGEVLWSCPTLPLKVSKSGIHAELREGRHAILARESSSGREATTWIDVQRW